MKQIILINTNKEFKEGFLEGCKEKNIPCITLSSKYMVMVCDKGVTNIFHDNDQLKFKSDDYIFIRLRGKDAQFVSIFAHFLELNNIPFTDHYNIYHTEADSKIRQMMILNHYKLPIPKSIITTWQGYQKNKQTILSHISFPCVLKMNGARGEAVWKIENTHILEKKMQELTTLDEEKKVLTLFLIQEYIENNYDVRVTMFGDTVLGVIERMATDGFYNNYSRGGTYRVSHINDYEYELSNQARKAMKLELAGVDFVKKPDGSILFFEVNKSPQINKKYPRELPGLIQKNY